MLHQYWATVQTEFGSLPGAKEVGDLVETMTYEVHGARVPHFDAVISKWGNDPDVPNCPTGPALWGRDPNVNKSRGQVLPGYAASMARKWRGGPRGIWYSDEHETEAKEAQLRKPPSRFGTWVLRHLGYRGEIGERAPHAQTRHSHERPVHRPPGN
jgi:hypothetical protein